MNVPAGGADREGPDLARVVGGERAVAGREPGGKLLAMEPVEVERVVAERVDHARTIAVPGDSCGLTQPTGAVRV